MRVLCIGDVIGKPGRQAVRRLLPQLRERHGLDLVIANGENAAGGIGLTPETATDLYSAGVDLLTGGNHIWRHKELLPFLDREPRLIRPLNYPDGTPGRGVALVEKPGLPPVAVIDLLGRVFMDPVPCPFAAAERALGALAGRTPVVLVEIHAEATSEKRALGWALDGKASAVFGTHTHVPTADEEILPGGTAYVTDLGMTGPYRSVIGMRKEEMIARLRTLRPATFVVPDEDVRLCGAVFEIDPTSGRALGVERVREVLP